MAPEKNTVYVVTGANRGIGLGLVKALLSRPSTTVVATVRSDDAAASLKADIASVTKGDQSTLDVVKLDLSTAPTPEQVRNAITVDHVDVLINNAGFSPPMNPAVETTADELRAAFETNTIGSLMVFQGLWPLLQKSAAPKVINVTSSVGCITHQEAPGGSYGPSKAALNWLTRALHTQNEGLVAVALHPGWVKTRMGELCANDWGFPNAPFETIEGCVEGMLQIIDGATREKFSGKFVTYKGQELPCFRCFNNTRTPIDPG
ncbi:aps10 [Fusarium albosuccineum]|uniref:Aps10 n=1 Tax=Fusarium albosuccineum TaxID=1237068 RepID=A0A8H4LKD4_9HYPO|nr:aps10 [Fusarium albosuccineum]